MAPDDERNLCRRIAEGDEGAFASLVERYQTRVYAFCARMLGDAAEAEDVAQEVFLTIYRNASAFRGDALLSTWILRIAKNQTLNRLKYLDRRGRSGRRSLDELGDERLAHLVEDGAPLPDEIVDGGNRARLVHEAIQGLGEEHRLVVVLRDVEDLSYEEIAEITGLPLGTVKSRIHRARSVLARRLQRLLP